jgi:uncharacterized protein (DUF4415 family)
MKSKLDKNGKSTLSKVLKKAIKAPKKDVKIRVNTFIDLDIYEALNNEAMASGEKYQTLLNKYLRAAVFKEVSLSDIKAIKIALGA